MRSAFATLAFVALAAANPMPADGSGALEGCSPNYAGNFSINQVNVTSSSSKRSIYPRSDDLTMELHNGKLTDSEGRTGYIASNDQFQFDGPPQAGALQTSGFSVCENGSLTLNSAIWYSCLSGDFYNLYDASQGKQCFQVYLEVVGGGASTTSAPAGGYGSTATAAPTGYGGGSETQATTAATGSGASTECGQISDGQPQCSSIESPTPTPECTEYKDGQPQCSTAKPTTKATAAPTTAPTAAPTAEPAPAATPTPSSECGQIGDGQPQCNQTYTGPLSNNAPNTFVGIQHRAFGLAVGVLAVAMWH